MSQQLNVQFSPIDQIQFPYVPNKHLIGSLKITNKNNFPIVYKFKASTVNRFVIRPNQGCLKPDQTLDVQIVFHKDGVESFESQKIQVVYGKTYEEALSKFYTLNILNFSKNDKLNLTMMVEQKENRVKNLEDEIQKYSSMPRTTVTGTTSSIQGKSSLKLKNIMLVLFMGFIFGFFAPVRMFRKGGILSFIAQADQQAIQRIAHQDQA